MSMTDFANFIQTLLDANVLDLTDARFLTNQFLIKQDILTADEAKSLTTLKAAKDALKAQSVESSKGT